MKTNLPVTDHEVPLSADACLVSTTDLKGITLYANDDFQHISGFSVDELIGKNHNLVRHPDMPPLAFADLWQRLKQGESWMGVVKNRCKNGDFYWVDAYISPIFKGSEHVGYQSVRVKAGNKLAERAQKTYSAINAGRQKGPKKRWSAYGLLLGLVLTQILSTLFILYLADSRTLAGFLVGCSGLVILGASAWFLNPLKNIYGKALNIIDNPVAQQVYSGNMSEFGALDLALRMQEAQLRTVIGRVEDATRTLSEVATSTDAAMHEAEQGVRQQEGHLDELTQMAEQLSGSIHELEDNFHNIHAASQAMNQETQEGQRSVQASVESVHRMAERFEMAVERIEQLSEDAEAINASIDSIVDIADQTNLLALNAAIEAARAGESGRGFAVVADAVRQLAKNTQEVTETITQRIEAVRSNISLAVEQVNASREDSQQTVDQIEAAGLVFTRLTDAADGVLLANQRVNAAIEQQTQASDRVVTNLEQVRDLAHTTRDQTESTANSADNLTEQVKQMHSLARAFGRG